MTEAQFCDEVVTGFGRLGHWFATLSEFGVQPDLITSAKGLTSGYISLGRRDLLGPHLGCDTSGPCA